MLGNGHCSTCSLEPQCGYPYKPCDCALKRKFRPKPDVQERAATLIPDAVRQGVQCWVSGLAVGSPAITVTLPENYFSVLGSSAGSCKRDEIKDLEPIEKPRRVLWDKPTSPAPPSEPCPDCGAMPISVAAKDDAGNILWNHVGKVCLTLSCLKKKFGYSISFPGTHITAVCEACHVSLLETKDFYSLQYILKCPSCGTTQTI